MPVRKADVLIAGGGPAGFAAAIAAARNGASVILVERYGFLGGMATAGLVNGLPKRHLETVDNSGKHIIEGIVKEIVERLRKDDAITRPETGAMLVFDSEEMKYLMLEMAEEAGIKQMLHTVAVDATVRRNKILGVAVESKSGREEIQAAGFIDATGDGDTAAKAGAPFAKGRESDGLTLPMTLIFKVGNVDNERFSQWLRQNPGALQAMADEAVKRGELKVSTESDELGFIRPFPERIVVRIGNPKWGRDLAGVDGAEVFRLDCSVERDLTKAEIEARKEAMSLTRWLRKSVPGFESARIALTATQIGVRESRRFVGEYTLSEDDIKAGATFDDVIARSIVFERTLAASKLHETAVGFVHDIPYRCLVPKKIDGILVAGRCISTTQKAQDWTRNMNTCMATGQAAGTAIALAVREGLSPRRVDISELQKALLKQGVNLGNRFQ